MTELKERILSSFADGTLLKTIFKESIGKDNNREKIRSELVTLNNNGTIDLISTYKDLKNDTTSKADFFLTSTLLN